MTDLPLTGRIVQAVCLPALLCAACTSPGSTVASIGPAPDSDAGHAVELAHWQAYYESALDPEPAPNPYSQIPQGGDGVSARPSIRAKYDRTPARPGMEALLASEFQRIVRTLPAAQATAFAGWKVVVARCAPVGPALLTVVDGARKQICIAPILAASIFFQSSGTDMARFTKRLRDFGLDPERFTGEYSYALNRKGLTKADWDRFLPANAEPTWTKVRRSYDFVLARAISCGILSKGQAGCTADAAALLKRSDTKVDPSSLVGLLRGASPKYDEQSWGYEAAGDADAVAAQIASASAP